MASLSGAETLTITQPDDFHLHVRDGQALKSVVPHAARQFRRAIIMPNLKPPVTTVRQAMEYRDRILAAVPPECEFEPLMTLYLTDETKPEDVLAAKQAGILAFKLYPAGATTNSQSGVTSMEKVGATLQAMQEEGLLLLIHGEDNKPGVDMFDRERAFVEEILPNVRQKFPDLKIVLEHITTKYAVDFVLANRNVAATITPQHILFNRNALFQGGLRPHMFCLPILKHEKHREAIHAAAVSGDPRFFLGTDSAPHAKGDKESACGCAGIYSSPVALPVYADAFERAGALDKLEAFASFHGADFYGLARNSGKLKMRRESWAVPVSYDFGEKSVIPLYAGQSLAWNIEAQQ